MGVILIISTMNFWMWGPFHLIWLDQLSAIFTSGGKPEGMLLSGIIMITIFCSCCMPRVHV